jgi:hypothetical protein
MNSLLVCVIILIILYLIYKYSRKHGCPEFSSRDYKGVVSNITGCFCLENMIWNGSSCICPTGMEYSSMYNKCVDIDPNKIYIPEKIGIFTMLNNLFY